MDRSEACETDQLLPVTQPNKSYGINGHGSEDADSVSDRDVNISTKTKRGRVLSLVSQCLPLIGYLSEYRWSWLWGDLIAAITLASVYVPMSVSFALLAASHPVSGLTSFVISPMLYALFGSCPQMVVGPEAPGSLLVGNLVRNSHHNRTDDTMRMSDAELAGAVTALTGAVLLLAGVGRLGLIECLLNRPFMRSFICALGFGVLVEQAIPMFGIEQAIKSKLAATRGNTILKVVLILRNLKHTHVLTAVVSLMTFVIVMTMHFARTHGPRRWSRILYLPDRLIAIAITGMLTWVLGWQNQGMAIVGDIGSFGPGSVPFRWPFQFDDVPQVGHLLSMSFTVACLGFFESLLTVRALNKITRKQQTVQPVTNTNQELIALGVANLACGSFLGIPGFGGYGRSKLNVSSGAATPMSSVFLSFLAMACIAFLLPAFYYVPKGVLGALIFAVGVSMIEECPADVRFLVRIKAWPELCLMVIVFFTTICYSSTFGMALGIGLSTLVLVYNWAVGRSRSPASLSDTDASTLSELKAQHGDHLLLLHVSRKLHFANVGRVEKALDKFMRDHRSSKKGARYPDPDIGRTVVFLLHNSVQIDACATQIIYEIVEERVKRGDRTIFCVLTEPEASEDNGRRLRRSGVFDLCGEERSYVTDISDLSVLLSDQHNGTAT